MTVRTENKQLLTDKELYAQFESISISHSVLSRIPYHISIEYFILPYSVDEKGRIEVLMAYPHDAEMIQAVQVHTGVCIKPTEIAKDYLLKLIAKHYDIAKSDDEIAAVEKEDRGPQRLSYSRTDSTISIVNDIIHEAIRLRASDIHMEPFEREMCVRFRVERNPPGDDDYSG